MCTAQEFTGDAGVAVSGPKAKPELKGASR